MLSLFCVITLKSVMLDYSPIADVVAILRDHAMFDDIRKNQLSRFCRYFA